MCLLLLGTYIPCKEVAVEETIKATVIKPNQSIKLRARKETKVWVGVYVGACVCVCMHLHVCACVHSELYGWWDAQCACISASTVTLNNVIFYTS